MFIHCWRCSQNHRAHFGPVAAKPPGCCCCWIPAKCLLVQQLSCCSRQHHNSTWLVCLQTKPRGYFAERNDLTNSGGRTQSDGEHLFQPDSFILFVLFFIFPCHAVLNKKWPGKWRLVGHQNDNHTSGLLQQKFCLGSKLASSYISQHLLRKLYNFWKWFCEFSLAHSDRLELKKKKEGNEDATLRGRCDKKKK